MECKNQGVGLPKVDIHHHDENRPSFFGNKKTLHVFHHPSLDHTRLLAICKSDQSAKRNRACKSCFLLYCSFLAVCCFSRFCGIHHGQRCSVDEDDDFVRLMNLVKLFRRLKCNTFVNRNTCRPWWPPYSKFFMSDLHFMVFCSTSWQKFRKGLFKK